MGWFFSLSAEIGPNRAKADCFAEYFSRVLLKASNHIQFSCLTGVWPDRIGENDNYWCLVSPKNADGELVSVFENSELLTELGYELYKHLYLAPDFRYALVGIEVDGFIDYDELIVDEPEEYNGFDGLVISEDIWQLPGRPDCFVKFKPGYLWIPYIGTESM